MDRQKIFVVSNNKTGTSSLLSWAKTAGLRTADEHWQLRFARSFLLDSFQRANFRQLQKHIARFEFFQDVPFSLAFLLPWLTYHYPQARYIYVKRDPEIWYRSFVNHQLKFFSPEARRAFQETGVVEWGPKLEIASRNRPFLGHPLHHMVRVRFGTPPHDPYSRKHLVRAHESHVAQALVLLGEVRSKVIDFSELSAEGFEPDLAAFCNVPSSGRFPHLNSSGQNQNPIGSTE